jgi:hypothetical protein
MRRKPMSESPTRHDYWHFYWPLAFMGIVAVAGRLTQNRILLGYGDGDTELALFTLALAAFGPFRSALIFVPQMSNVLVRGPRSFRAALRFLVTVCAVSTLPVLLLGWTGLGSPVLRAIYSKGPEDIHIIVLYMRFLTPLIVVDGIAGFLTGLLVQTRRTKLVTLLRVSHIAMLIGMLAAGLALGWRPVINLGSSMLAAGLGHLLLAAVLLSRTGRSPAEGQDRALSQREIAGFFMPMVLTTLLFTTSRPILFGFLTAQHPTSRPGLPDVDTMVAAVSLAFSFNMIFQASVNQFRNLLVTFGHEDLAGVRRFMRRTALALTGIMVFAAAGPLSVWFLRDLQGASGELLRMARQCLWPLCLAPLVVTWRNYNHGLTMVRRRTWSMAAGGIGRNVSIAAAAFVLWRCGLYNHVAAAAMLVLGFAGEALVVAIGIRQWPEGRPDGPQTEDDDA